MTTTISKWGNSQGIRIPKHLLDSIHWHENEPVELFVENDTLVIRKAHPSSSEGISIHELFAGYNDPSPEIEVDWGKSEGNEIW